MAGTAISWGEIRRMRAQKNFRQWYARYRAKILQRMDQSREDFETNNVQKAIEVHAWALDRAKEKDDYRAVGPLAEPAIKAMYRVTNEEQAKPTIVLNLGGFAQQHLAAEPIEVEYEALPPGEHDSEPT